MSVDSVNNSNNTALYTASGAVLGAGVAAGYLTKPFLKDGAPTDEFIKKWRKILQMFYLRKKGQQQM